MNLHDEIEKMAYELYEKSGKVEGRDIANWLEAEKIVMAGYKERGELGAGSSSPSLKKKKVSTTKRSIKKS